jgi:hypothetical protein
MAGVAFYVVPHVGLGQLIEYICRQCEIKPIDDNVVSDEHCQLCNGWLAFKNHCIET